MADEVPGAAGPPGRRRALFIVLAGLVLVLTYQLLSTFQVGEIGADTDIGGGLILLAGLVLVVTGLAMLVVWTLAVWWTSSRAHRRR